MKKILAILIIMALVTISIVGCIDEEKDGDEKIDSEKANDDSISVVEDSTNNQIDVLLNDDAYSGDDLDIIGVTQPSNGITTFTIDYVFFTPVPDYNGLDHFYYSITDNNGGTFNATVNITITSVNDTPMANNDNVFIIEDSINNLIDVLANDTDIDGDNLAIQFLTEPDHGKASIDGAFVSYTPVPDYNGSDQFNYNISDGKGGNDTATVYIDILGVNDPPNAVIDMVTIIENLSNNKLDVLSNDYDLEGDSLTIVSVGVPNHGFASHDNKYVYYSPNVNYTGADQFDYKIDDGNGGFHDSIVYVTIVQIPRIAYTNGTGDGNEKLIISNADGTEPIIIEEGNFNKYNKYIAWSHDGSKLLYNFANKTTIITNPNGTVKTHIGKGIKHQWSPDDSIIAFERTVVASPTDAKEYIFVVNSDGTNETKLCLGEDPKWLFDGKNILFKEYSNYDNYLEYGVINMDTLEEKTIIDATDFPPYLSPDRTLLAYCIWGGYNALNPTSYVIDTEGNKMGSNWYGMIEGWTPDGRVIYTYEGTDGDRSIYTIDSDGTNKTLLYDNYRNNIIQFSSDGKNIIYTRKDSNTAPINETNIYLSDSDGTNEKLIVSHARLPILSPFDSFIVYENLDNKLTYVKHLATDVTYFFGETGYLYRKSAWQPV